MKPRTNTVLMIEPVAFGYNEQTAVNNYFQRKEASTADSQSLALAEFREMVDKLTEKGVNVVVVPDTPMPHTPDSIFPNNWISFHEDGRVAIYPMYAENRRQERRLDILETLKEKGFNVESVMDYTASERENRFLEGTGSIILDREHKIAYAAISERTDEKLFEQFCADFGYKAIPFHSYQSVNGKRLAIYHTNVMMCLGDRFAVVCLDCIDDHKERTLVAKSLVDCGKELIDITEEQMHHFAGNMLQIENGNGKPLLVMSKTAYDSLAIHQVERLNSFSEIIAFNIPTIEQLGGGSVRCMMAELFLPKR
ncbi:MAG: citrulline utilization hydrolase CtlX [Bacteroidales bacterium]